MITRRTMAGLLLASPFPAGCAARRADAAADALAALEARAEGRLGVCMRDARTGETAGWRADERFALCSTFKLPLAGLTLAAIDRGALSFDARVPIADADMVPHAPVTGPARAQGFMTVGALAHAAQAHSDNVAANLLLARLGGPAGFTAALRALGDDVTRLDRLEPELNLVLPGDVRDTTTPRAMAATTARFLHGEALSPAARATLSDWTVATATGLKRLRAGLPAAWRAGDKTGTALADGMASKLNDVAMVWPDAGAPFTVAAYYEAPFPTDAVRDEDQAVLAQAGAVAAAWAQARS
ncbi:MAG: class A beta-lactamase [Hyphomonadaceae bacterium]|nr:class A beta-lactamase [Hyphomonadaceae bacterium]